MIFTLPCRSPTGFVISTLYRSPWAASSCAFRPVSPLQNRATSVLPSIAERWSSGCSIFEAGRSPRLLQGHDDSHPLDPSGTWKRLLWHGAMLESHKSFGSCMQGWYANMDYPWRKREKNWSEGHNVTENRQFLSFVAITTTAWVANSLFQQVSNVNRRVSLSDVIVV